MKTPRPRLLVAVLALTVSCAVVFFSSRARRAPRGFADLRDSVGDERIKLSPGHAALDCAACHVPHHARPARARWSSRVSVLGRDSSEIAAASSDVCLSCHSGTASTFVDAHSFGVSRRFNSPHPVGADYAAAARRDPSAYVDPAANPRIVLEDGKVGCVSCHAVHEASAIAGGGLRHEVCVECHRR